MALINCPDCGRSVSDTAKTCPQCARPLNKQAFSAGAFFYLAVIVLGIIVYFYYTIVPIVGLIIIGMGVFGFLTILLRKFLSL